MIQYLFHIQVLISLTAFASALILQYHSGLDLCPLCLAQRFMVLLLGMVAALAVVHSPGQKGNQHYCMLASLLSFSGGLLAARHVWIEHLPPELMPSCLPGFEALATILPGMDKLNVLLNGAENCGDAQWFFYGLSIPQWSLILFSIFFLMSATGWVLIRRGRQSYCTHLS